MSLLRRLTRMLADLPVAVWLVAGALLMAPIYLRYFAWVLGAKAIEFWAPIR